MIELFYYPTPNGRKISILLEELGLEYKLTRVDIAKNEQFSDKFSKISPLNKIPLIIDNKDVVFESGAILIYLAKKNNFKFYPTQYEKNINENYYICFLLFLSLPSFLFQYTTQI